jgi:hypothetical protein
MEPYMTDDVATAPDGVVESAAAPASAPAAPATTPAAASEPAKPATGTVLDGVADKAVATPANWPENWRDLVSQDEKERKRLERFSSPAEVWKAQRELEKKLSSGKFKADLPDNPTEEQISAYRKDMGIPEDGKYDVEIGGGFVWSDEDKPNLDFFAKRAHELNMPQGEFKKSLQVYADLQNKALADMAERDKAVWKETEDNLRAEWGHEFRANMNMLERMFPPEIVEEVFTARGPSGVKLGGSKEFLNFLVGFMKKYAPDETIVPGGAGNEAAESELSKLDEEFKNDYPNFIRNEAKYKRWSDLKEAKIIREQRERKGRAA